MRALSLFVLPLVAVGLLVWVWSEPSARSRSTREADSPPAPRVVAPVTAPEPSPGAMRLPPPVPLGFVRGRVFDSFGRPVRRASVAVISPRPYRLVFTDGEGGYELPLYSDRPHLVEAALDIELAPARRRVRAGDGQDFRLQPAGHVFGEVVAADEPVREANVDLFDGDEWVLDTQAENGRFTFTDEPPRDVALRLRIRSRDALAPEERVLVYRGERLDLGRIELVHLPAVRVRMKKPDGTFLVHVRAIASTRRDEGEWSEHALPGYRDLVVLPERAGGRRHLLLGSGEFLAARDVEFQLDVIGELGIAIEPGPIPYHGRLRDESGRPVRARFGKTETDLDGRFWIDLPWSGVHRLVVTGLHLPDHGWLRIERGPVVLVDSERPQAFCRLALGARVLGIGSGYFGFEFVHRASRERFDLWRNGTGGAQTIGAVLTRALPVGGYRWTSDDRRGEFELAAGRLTVLDLTR